ncbi:MBL fold metallo-hydrolase [Haloarcula nitratireducens]|uniref:MBL fold metallo-hydrolase n=1 Tax=Haloarcula nitratireducens TaxID=2487749 RepID=A0AAW4P6C4_9EURY|nr:MBL fold metallo-hydrolase [Halomicroarcula nitratireducens]MBX0293416.1 MBL fold metallo-hydrolase [Halomicroarcula nitratireducens]
MPLTRVDLEVATRAPTGRTAAYLSDGPEALLIDPAARADALDAAVADTQVNHVAVTHHHPDHVGAVAHYARETDATTWARRGRAADFEAAAGVAPDRTFAEGTAIPAGDGVTVLDLPGHAPEHVGFETAAGVVSGDTAVAQGSVVVGAPEGDVRAYLTSLRRLHARDPPRLHPGHGPTITDPRATCARLLAHRLDRERRVRAAVAGGASTLDEILDAAYEKDLTGVRDLARATVAAHVEKLAAEGALRWDGERAVPTGDGD